MQVSEFKNKEMVFIGKKFLDNSGKKSFARRGYTISNSANLLKLKKILKIDKEFYNSYVTIATYSEMPHFPLAPKLHWPLCKEWIKTKDKTIIKMDFFLDFDGEPTTEGITSAWKDSQKALTSLKELIGEDAKYLTTWFSGNKGFHILGKCRIGSNWGNTGQEIVDKQKEIAEQLVLLYPTVDTTIYDTGRIRKLLGSTVYSTNFGKTRVIPVSNEQEFKELIVALEQKDFNYFEKKELLAVHNVDL